MKYCISLHKTTWARETSLRCHLAILFLLYFYVSMSQGLRQAVGSFPLLASHFQRDLMWSTWITFKKSGPCTINLLMPYVINTWRVHTELHDFIYGVVLITEGSQNSAANVSAYHRKKIGLVSFCLIRWKKGMKRRDIFSMVSLHSSLFVYQTVFWSSSGVKFRFLTTAFERFISIR